MLGESFHVDTVAHLLRPMVKQMPAVPVVLSLFDGIGAAKLALKRCGVGRCVYIAVSASTVGLGCGCCPL